MSDIEVSSQSVAGAPPVNEGEFKLEVVVLPVSDVDRAKRFYEGLGWRLDADVAPTEDFRVVQLTPPGSACSIQFGIGVTLGRARLGAEPLPGRSPTSRRRARS